MALTTPIDMRIIASLGGPLTLVTVTHVRHALGPGRGEATVRRHLGRMRRLGLAESEREGPREWWSSTARGRTLLAGFEDGVTRRLRVVAPGRASLRPDGAFELTGAGPSRILTPGELDAAAAAPSRATPPARASSLAAALRG